jgi:hypothetical protein
LALVLFSGCVSQTKYSELETELSSAERQMNADKESFSNLQIQNEKLASENRSLLETVEGLKLELKNERSEIEQTEGNITKSEPLTAEKLHPYSILLSSCQLRESIPKVLSIYNETEVEPYVVKIDLGDKGIWWRILAGHFETREAAIIDKNKNDLTDKIVLKGPFENHIDNNDNNKNIAENTESLLVKKEY